MRETLEVPKGLADQIVEHCIAGRPNEACGILGSRDGKVVEVFLMANAARSPMRYALDASEQFRVYKTLDQRGLELGGVFHSHTHTEAVPSPTDVKLASEDVPYVIVSLATDPPSIRAFRIAKASWTDEDGDIEEVGVNISG